MHRRTREHEPHIRSHPCTREDPSRAEFSSALWRRPLKRANLIPKTPRRLLYSLFWNKMPHLCGRRHAQRRDPGPTMTRGGHSMATAYILDDESASARATAPARAADEISAP